MRRVSGKKKGGVTPFKKLIERYDAFFFDAYGVLNSAQGLMPQARETLGHLHIIGKPFYVISNDSSVSVEQLSAKYNDPDWGNLVPPERIVCSGLVAQQHLSRLSAKKIVYVGQKSAEIFLQGPGRKLINATEISANTQADVLAIMSVNGYDWQVTLNKLVNFIRRNPQMKLFCPNPDLIFHAQSGEVGIAAGGLAAMIEALLNVKFRYFGKPEVDIFQFTYGLLKKKYPKVMRKKILMVGDGIRTDIRGAKNFGIASALVLSGITQRREIPMLTKMYRAKANYVCEDVGL